jgi:hypothetical protein
MGGNKMSEQSTPQIIEIADGTKCVRLEDFLNERNEANELLAGEKATRNYIIKRSVEVEKERNEARKKCASWVREWRELRVFCRQLDEDANDRLQERDEARKALADWENAAAHVEADHPDEKHCGCVSVLRKLLADARSDRDEAREEIRDWKRLYDAAERGVDLTIAEGTISDLLKQRDEARERERVAWNAFDEERQRASREGERVLEARRERDEAREELSRLDAAERALMEIEDRCVDGEDACDDIQKIRDIAVKALVAGQ